MVGSGIRIRDPIKPIPDPGSRGPKGTGSRIRIRNTGFKHSDPPDFFLNWYKTWKLYTEYLYLLQAIKYNMKTQAIHISVFTIQTNIEYLPTYPPFLHPEV